MSRGLGLALELEFSDFLVLFGFVGSFRFLFFLAEVWPMAIFLL